MSITELFVKRPTLAFVMIATILLFGTYSVMALVKQQFPTVDLPVVSLQYAYVGASSTEMRDAIVRPVEDALAGAPNLDHLDTSIEQGQATISATFTLDSDKNTDLIEAQRRAQSAQGLLPTDVRSPFIGTFDPSQSLVTTLVVSSTTLEPNELSAIVENQVVPAIEQVPGVSNVLPQGAVNPAIMVTADPARLAASGATLNDLVTTISSNNSRTPGGYATENGKETSIDVRGDIRSPQSILDLRLVDIATPNGTTNYAPWTTPSGILRVGDVADAEFGYEPPRSFASFKQSPAIILDVLKATGASEVDASKAILAALPGFHKTFPQIAFAASSVEAKNTEQQLSGVVRTLIEGILLTAIVMVFFLRSWRNAIVVMLAIPTALGITFGAMRLAGFTIDVISLLAMTLIIGILVDDSIVVLENTERRRDLGEEPKIAAVRGRTEIALAAVTITLVDVVVFAPIAFLPGIVGKFLNEFGLVVVVATLSSLLVSFTLTPALAGNWSLLSHWKPPAIINAFTRGFEALQRWYVQRALGWGLRNPVIVIAVCVLSLIGAIALIPNGVVGFEFIPTVDRGELTVQLTFPSGTAVAYTRDQVARVEKYIDGIGSDLDNETTIAGASTSAFGGLIPQGSVAEIAVNLADGRKQTTDAWTKEFKARIPEIVPSAKVLVIPSTGVNGGVNQPIDYVVTASGGSDPFATASEYAGRAAALLARVPGAVDIDNGATALSPQVEVNFNRDAARSLNVNVADAANAIRAAFGGLIATQWVSPTGLQDVTIIYPEDARHEISSIASIPIRSFSGAIVHIGDFATVRDVPAPAIITRQNRQTIVTLGANVAAGFTQSNITRDFNNALPSLHLPPNVAVAPNSGGNQQNLTDTINGIAFALIVAATLVYLLMVALFNSYRGPAIIIFSVPVAVVGALGSLAVAHLTLNLFSMIGTVLLIGLVAKNGILLVDFANRARAHGYERRAAIEAAANIRFRPIVMTTISMISGMLPIALAIDPGSDTRRALGVVVIGGLLSSLVLTLLLVPILYMYLAPRKVAAATDAAMPI